MNSGPLSDSHGMIAGTSGDAGTAVILASGPSLTNEQVMAARLSGYYTVVVNATFQRMLDADVLYGGDFMFWKHYWNEITNGFKGKLYTQDGAASTRWPAIKRQRGINREGLGKVDIHNNGNSGVQAINLAYLWGYRRIVLLGFDMKLGPKGERHHHADHPHPMVQAACFEEWLHKLDKFSKEARDAGLEIIDCTPDGAIECFPKRPWQEVL